jgi:hypothetical protein
MSPCMTSFFLAWEPCFAPEKMLYCVHFFLHLIEIPFGHWTHWARSSKACDPTSSERDPQARFGHEPRFLHYLRCFEADDYPRAHPVRIKKSEAAGCTCDMTDSLVDIVTYDPR